MTIKWIPILEIAKNKNLSLSSKDYIKKKVVNVPDEVQSISKSKIMNDSVCEKCNKKDYCMILDSNYCIYDDI